MVQNLVCAGSTSSSVLSFSWEQPSELGNEVVGYQVTVNRLEHKAGTRDVVQDGVYSDVIETKDASISRLGKEYIVLYIQRLASYMYIVCLHFCSW